MLGIAGVLPEKVDISGLQELWPVLFEEINALSEMKIDEMHDITPPNLISCACTKSKISVSIHLTPKLSCG